MTDDIQLALRPLLIADIDERYLSWYQNSDGHLSYYTTSGRTFSKEVLIDEINRAEQDGKHFYAIVDTAHQRVIGNVRIGPIHTKHKTADLVTLIGDRAYLGKGLAPVIIKMGNQIAFEQHDIRKLFGGMIEGNIPSLKGYLRADWVIEGIMRSHYLIDNQPQDFITVACFNPRYFDPAFMHRAQQNHAAWYAEVFKS
jgi:[ribosomal protein S5]-alanine N-acetyltransferase